MRKRDILLIIIILIFGLFVEAFITLKEKRFPFFLDIGGKANFFQEEKSVPLQPGSAIAVENSHGDIDFITWEKDEIKVELEKVIYADDYKQATEISDKIFLKFEQKDQVPLVSTTRGEADLKNIKVRTNMKISVPARISPSVKIEHGTLAISGLEGNTAVNASDSEGNIRNMTGSVTLIASHSDMGIESISAGTVNVEYSHGSGEYTDINGDLKLLLDHASATITDSKQNLSITAKKSDMIVRGARGSLTIESENGEIDAETVEGSATIKSSYDTTRLSNIQGKLDVTSMHGDVEVWNAVSDATIDTEYGRVTLGIPSAMSFAIKCIADNGNIKSDFDELVPREEKLNSILDGKIGEGGPRYLIKAKYNDIVLEKMIDEGRE